MEPAVPRDPFRPIAAVVAALIAVFAIAAILDLVGVLAWSAPNPGDIALGSENCVKTLDDQTSLKVSTGPNLTYLGDPLPAQSQVKPGVTVLTGLAKVCLQNPTLAQRSAAVFPSLGAHVIDATLLILILVSITTGRRNGLFTVAMSQRVRTLGWVALAASVIWPLVAAASKGAFIQAAFVDTSWTHSLRHPHYSWAAVVTALGVITVARVLRKAVLLQEDLDEIV